MLDVWLQSDTGAKFPLPILIPPVAPHTSPEFGKTGRLVTHVTKWTQSHVANGQINPPLLSGI
jgi:hypothetical protein